MTFSLSTEIDLSSELDSRPARPVLHEAGKDSGRKGPRALALCGLALAAATAAFALACLVTGRLPWRQPKASRTAARSPATVPAVTPARSEKPAKPKDNLRDPPPRQSSAAPPPAGPPEPVPELTSPPTQKDTVAVRPFWAQRTTPQPRPRPAPRPAGFDPKPYFSGADNPAAKLNQKDLAGAQSAAERLSTDAGFQYRKQAQFVLALTLARKGECAKALLILGNLETTYPLLKPYILVETAKCHLHLKQPSRAEQAVLKVDPKSPLTEAATLLNGVALMHQQKWAQAAALYRRHLNSGPRNGVAEARYHLAVALGKTNAPLKQILPQLRLIRADFPLTRLSRKALTRMRKLLAGKPGKVRRYWLRLSCRLAVTRARKLISARKYRRAVTELRSAVRQRDCSTNDRCAVHYLLAQATFKGISRKHSAALFERAVHRCDPAGPKDLRAKAKYQAGRANRARRRYQRALAFFRRVEREHPHHSYADDARLRRAETYRLMRKKNLAMYSYKTLVKRYPKGDMRQEALWRITRQAYFDGKLTETLNLLNLAARTVTREKGPHAEGRTFYWMGRVLTRLGRPSGALAAYTRAVRLYPLTYYALLSLERVRQLSPQTASKLQTEMAPDQTVSNWTLTADPVFKSAGFKRAVELARLGLARQVLKELSHLGLKVPKKPPRPKELAALTPARRTRLWVTAVLLDRAGLFHLSHWLPRHTLRKYRTAYPRGTNLKYWRVAFPTVFKKLVNTNAARFNVPPELLIALIREESAFNPRQVSRARAIGLTQLLITTARRFARKLKLRITVATLKRPEVNVPVGARYLGWLLRLFKGRKTLAVAAYNCGERRVKRWVRNRKNLQVDEFVELIPIDETRKYTKRVLGSAFAYRALGRPANPSVPIAFKLPAQASKPTRGAPSKVAIRR